MQALLLNRQGQNTSKTVISRTIQKSTPQTGNGQGRQQAITKTQVEQSQGSKTQRQSKATRVENMEGNEHTG